MSHYDCVLPVDFERLSRVVMPAWLDFIAGKRDPLVFAHQFAPLRAGVAGLDVWLEDDWESVFDLSSAYIDWFRCHAMTEWTTETLHSEFGALQTDSSVPWCADDLLMLVIKQSSAIELLGANRFEPSHITPFADFQFYGRLHEPPFVQVVGTKNSFWFLSEFYEFHRESLNNFSSCARKHVVSAETYSLLDRLFFSVRAFPGTRWMRKSLVWPDGDDSALIGFLSPDETQLLADKVPEMERALVRLEEKPWPFDLFVDRLQRSASAGIGLVTLFSGL